MWQVSRVIGFLKYAKKFVQIDILIQRTEALLGYTFATAAHFGEVVVKLDYKLCKNCKI